MDYEDCVEDGEVSDDVTSLGNQFGIPVTFNAYIQVKLLNLNVDYLMKETCVKALGVRFDLPYRVQFTAVVPQFIGTPIYSEQ